MGYITVKTESGRVYDIDLEGGAFRANGVAPIYVEGEAREDTFHREFTPYKSLTVDGMDRLVIFTGDDFGGRRSTPIVEGLDDLRTALAAQDVVL